MTKIEEIKKKMLEALSNKGVYTKLLSTNETENLGSCALVALSLLKEKEKEVEEFKKATKDLIFTASKLWDEVKPIKDSGAMIVTHPIIEQAIYAYNSLTPNPKQ
jgi:hypothetical protein